MRPLALYCSMFLDLARWHAVRVAARILYIVLVAGGAVVGFAIGAASTLAAVALTIFALVTITIRLLHLMGAFRDPIHLALDVAILAVLGLGLLLAVPMYLALRALTLR